MKNTKFPFLWQSQLVLQTFWTASSALFLKLFEQNYSNKKCISIFSNGPIFKISTNGIMLEGSWEVVTPRHVKQKVRLSNWFMSVRQSHQFTIVSLWVRNNLFEWNVIFWTWIGTWIGRQVCHFTVLCLWIHPNCTCAERSEITLLLYVWQSNKIENHYKQETYCF